MADEVKNDPQMLDLQADIDEFRKLLKEHATRPNVKKVLQGWVDKCEIEKKSMEKVLATQFPKKLEKVEEEKIDGPADVALKIIDKMVYDPLNKFGWDQQDKKVKVYITSGVDGIGELPKGQVTCEF